MTWQAIFVGLQIAAFKTEGTMPVIQQPDNPFRVAAMTAVGNTLVVEILGSYQGLLDEQARLLAHYRGPGPADPDVALALGQNQRLLDLYAALQTEAARLIGAGDNERNRDG